MREQATAEVPALGQAVARLRSGGLVAYPTETVFGLGADARSRPAVERLRHWKGREPARPLSLLVSGLEAAGSLGVEVSTAARRLADAFWPGPVTLVLPAPPIFAPGVARADGAVGLRCSLHPVAGALARRLEREGVGPATATSFNRSGEAPARSYAEARQLCANGGEAPQLLEHAGPDAWGEPPSSVVDLTGRELRVLRPGPIGAEALVAIYEEAARA